MLALQSIIDSEKAGLGPWQASKVRAKIRGSLGFVLGNFQ